MDDFDIEKAKKEMRTWAWWGIATFFKCPWDEDPNNCDIALVGVPHSSGNGSTERDQHLAPRALRNVSGWYRRGHQHYGIVPWDVCRINDMGDTPLPEAMVNDTSVKHIEAYFKTIDAAGARPVSIGGDHSITGPIIKAIAGKNARSTNGRKTALLHFDAHRDDYQHMPHWLGNRRSAAHWAHYTVMEEHVDPERSIQLGIRGNPMIPREDATHSELGYKIITADEFFKIGIEETVRTIRERVGDAPLYITFDLDVLDPAEAPAVSNMEPMHRGLRAWQCLEIFYGLRGMNIIGADIVCMMPTKDTEAKTTAMTAMVVMFELVALISDHINSSKA